MRLLLSVSGAGPGWVAAGRASVPVTLWPAGSARAPGAGPPATPRERPCGAVPGCVQSEAGRRESGR